MLAFLLIWLAAVGLSFIVCLGIVFYQYRMFLNSPIVKKMDEKPSFVDFLSMRVAEIAVWISMTS